MDNSFYIYVIRAAAIVWLLAGAIEWLFIFGILKEEAPRAIAIFFRSCAILNLLIAFGLWNLMEWARLLGLVVVILQFFSHSYILLGQKLRGVRLEKWRLMEIILFIGYLIFFNLRHAVILFRSN